MKKKMQINKKKEELESKPVYVAKYPLRPSVLV